MSDTRNRTEPLRVADVLKHLDRDVLHMPEAMVLEELQPGSDERAAKGVALIQGLLRTHKRESWRDSAAQAASNAKEKLATFAERAEQRAHMWIAEGRALPQGAFAGRQEGEITQEERFRLFVDLATTELLEEDDGDGDD